MYNLEPSYEEDPIGGVARFAAVMSGLREDLAAQGRAPPMLIFSGDFVGPSLMSSVTKGAHMIEAINQLGVHFATFGNHEFDYGYQSLINRLDGKDDDVADADFGSYDYPATTTQWIATNITEGKTGLPVGGEKYAKRTVLTTWGSGSDKEIKVGLLAVSENWLPNCTQLKTDELVYADFIKEARSAATTLRSQGAELVLAICHNRLEQDRQLAKEVPEIDVILGGHDHFYKNDRKNRLIKSGEEFRWLSHVRVEISPSCQVSYYVDRYDVDKEITPDPGIEKMCEKYHNLMQRKFSKVVATSKVALDPRDDVVRYHEGVLPNFVCDACAEDFSEKEGLQSADFCLLSGYTFAGKEAVAPGNVTLGDLTTVLRPNKLVVLKLTGEQVRKSLELGAKRLPDECGSLFHVSSRLKYTINLHPADPSTKKPVRPTVKDLLFDNQPIQLDKEYVVGVTDSTAEGKFGFDWMATAPRVIEEEHAAQILDVVLWYCARHKNEPVNPSLGRITISN